MTLKRQQLFHPEEKDFLIVRQPGNINWGKAKFNGIMDGVDSRKKVMQNEECIDFSKFMKDEVDNGDKGEFDTLMEKISKELNPKQLVFTDETDSEEK